jgi:hypothetical protein
MIAFSKHSRVTTDKDKAVKICDSPFHCIPRWANADVLYGVWIDGDVEIAVGDQALKDFSLCGEFFFFTSAHALAVTTQTRVTPVTVSRGCSVLGTWKSLTTKLIIAMR